MPKDRPALDKGNCIRAKESSLNSARSRASGKEDVGVARALPNLILG